MRNTLYFVLVLALLCPSSCTSVDSELCGTLGTKGGGIHRFYATTEQGASETKVYADENMKVLWNAGDLLTVFNQSTYNSKFQFAGDDGDNAGNFDDVTPSGLHSGNALSNIYAVYPYVTGNKINNAGNTLTLNLPAEQQYKEHSFGIGANTMVAVTDNSFLAFKNIGGYLQLRLYGDNVSVSSITIQGNNGEKIAGKANVAVGLGITPTVTMDDTATEIITLVCDPPVQLGTTAEQYTDFWFVIPPITFTGGFTITVTDELGGTFEKSTSKSLTISRSTIEWMAALEVVPNYDNVNVVFADANFKAYCVENFDTNGDGDISIAEARHVTSITVNTNDISSLEGIGLFTNLESLSCTPRSNGYTANLLSGEGYPIDNDGNRVRGLLKNLNLSNNIKLTSLHCSHNMITDLQLPPSIMQVDCYGNNLSLLNVTNCGNITSLNCGFNQLASLDVSSLSKLEILSCDVNGLTELAVDDNLELKELNCYANQLHELKLASTSLVSLYCGHNEFNTIDLSDLPALESFSCTNGQLTALEFSSNPLLTNVDCRSNQLEVLDISSNPNLTDLTCYDNKLTDINVSNNAKLTSFVCYFNIFETLDLSHNPELSFLYCGYNSNLSILDVSDNLKLDWLWCQGCSNLAVLWMYLGQTIKTFGRDDTTTIKYKDKYSDGDIEAVDLGLPSRLKWASRNVGANKSSEIGGRYAWGEIETKTYFGWSNYKWCDGTKDCLTKYCTSVDGKTTLENTDDAATQILGGLWRTPGRDELQELIDYCTWTPAEVEGGITGYCVTGPNGNSIFLPANGQMTESSFSHATSVMLWSSECGGDYSGIRLIYSSSEQDVRIANNRCDGLCIRAVMGERPVLDMYIESLSAGCLESRLASVNLLGIKSLRITGHMDARDFDFIKWECRNVQVIDLSEVVIDAYTGNDGTDDGYYNVSYPANEIPKNAFYYGTRHKTRPFPEELYDQGMPSLRQVILPYGVKSIGESAFRSAVNLMDIDLPEGLERVGQTAFRLCTSFKNLILPSSLTTYDVWSFTELRSLETVHCKAVTPPIENSAFFNTNSTTAITATLYVPTGSVAAYRNSQWGSRFSKIVEE